MTESPESREEPVRAADRQPRQGLNRVLYLLILISFLFPFAVIRGCSGGEERSYTGLELMVKAPGGLLAGVLVLAALLLVLSFRRRLVTPMRRGAGQALKALCCALAILSTMLATEMPFLFDRVHRQPGFFLCLVPWLVLYVLSMGGSVAQLQPARQECRDPPPPWGLAFAALLGAGILIAIVQSEPTSVGEAAIGSLLGLVAGAPLLLLVLFAATAHRLRRCRSRSA